MCTLAIAALWLYAIFPIVRNTFTGLRDAAPDVVQEYYFNTQNFS